MTWDLPSPFIHERIAVHTEIDGYGHVNNAVYVAWLDDCAWAHSISRGISPEICRSLDRGMAVWRTQINYIGAALEGDRGVGTFGGSEDHTAMLCCLPGSLSQYRFCPVRRERIVALPAHVRLVCQPQPGRDIGRLSSATPANVRFIPGLPFAEEAALFGRCRVLVMTSSAEGFRPRGRA